MRVGISKFYWNFLELIGSFRKILAAVRNSPLVLQKQPNNHPTITARATNSPAIKKEIA